MGKHFSEISSQAAKSQKSVLYLCPTTSLSFVRAGARSMPEEHRAVAQSAIDMQRRQRMHSGFLRKLHKYVCGDRVRPQPLSTLIRRVLQPT